MKTIQFIKPSQHDSKIKKTVWVLNVDDYAPEITAITYPFIKYYANRIRADFQVINKRKYPEMPVTYEKLQIYELGRGNDWNIYIDSDALIHPETLDFTEFLNKDTVLHNGTDMANIRWTYDNYFRRDGRNIGSCNWFTMASDWCIDLWHPLEDLTLEEAIARIEPTISEKQAKIAKEHLIDDFVLSRNIARFGLKFNTAIELTKSLGLPDANFFYHVYTVNTEEKVKQLKKVVKDWKIEV